VYETDPLLCGRCGGRMKIIAFEVPFLAQTALRIDAKAVKFRRKNYSML
jgi:hypothetical protein